MALHFILTHLQLTGVSLDPFFVPIQHTFDFYQLSFNQEYIGNVVEV